MPVLGHLGYDTHVLYSLINMVGYGERTGYLSTILRGDNKGIRMFSVDFAKDLTTLGESGDGIFAHFKHKFNLMIDSLYELA